MSDTDKRQASELTNEELETALIEGAASLQIAIGAPVPLRDYEASVAIVAAALRLHSPQCLSRVSSLTVD